MFASGIALFKSEQKRRSDQKLNSSVGEYWSWFGLAVPPTLIPCRTRAIKKTQALRDDLNVARD